MIIQNGQPRNYAICNGRKVLMLRGGQWIIKPFPLSTAVKSQIYADILDASLANEVWRAANLYCKAHQQAHPELTAQGKLLSTFVNNDPDMYASLPLALTPEAQSAMPTRYCVGDGTGRFVTNYIPNAHTKVICKFKRTAMNNTFSFGSRVSYNSRAFLFTQTWNSAGNFGWNYGNGYVEKSGNSIPLGKHTIEIKEGVLYIDGVVFLTRSTSQFTEPPTNPFSIFGVAWSGTSYSNYPGVLEYIGIADSLDSDNVLTFIPSKISNLMELLDLETLTLATRVGTFTEQKDIPNS